MVVPDGLFAPPSVQDAVQDLHTSIETLQRLSLPPGAAEAFQHLVDDAHALDEAIAGRAVASQQRKPRQADVGLRKDSIDPSMKPDSFATALTRLVSILWPRIDKYIERLIHESIEPSINASLPGMLQGGVKFTRVSLGSSSPMVEPIVVEDDPETGAIEVTMGMDLHSELDVEITAMGIGIGITNMCLKGDLVCLLTPPSTQPPFFGGLQMYFPNPPDMSINFAGAARLANIPGLRGAVRSALDSSIAGICVLPRRIAVDMNEEDDVDFIDMTYPEPLGVLRFTLRSGANLLAADTSLFGGAPSSDPYVKAALGIKTWTSPVIGKCLNPIWGGADGVTVDFPVHDHCQKLFLKVYDHDFGSADDLIGVADGVDVKDLTNSATASTTDILLMKESGEPGAGSLTVSSALLKLKDTRPEVPVPLGRPAGPSSAHLSLKVLTVRGLEVGAEYPFRVRLQVLTEEEPADKATPRFSRSNSLGSRKKSETVLRSSKTVQLGSNQVKQFSVRAEACTNTSTPRPQKELAEALQNICVSLSQKGHEPEDIADILDVSSQQVKQFLLSQQKTEEAEKALKEAAVAQQARAAVRKPVFDEVLQMLVPVDCEQGHLDLTVLDKNSKALGTACVEMSSLIEAPQLCLHGPFLTERGAEVVGSLRLHWLHY